MVAESQDAILDAAYHEKRNDLLREEEPSESLLRDHERELEAQSNSSPMSTSTPMEYSVSTTRKLAFLGVYFLLNLGLTLSNKAVLQHAQFPWLLTVMHATSTCLGCTSLLGTGHLQLTKLGTKEQLILVAFSSLFTLNIAISNVSLALVSVPFHQVLRSTCPVATILIYRVVYQRTYAKETYLSMIPLILGVGLATFGDYYFTRIGFALTLLGVFLAAIKTVASNRLMTGTLKLSALEILFRMSPLAAIQCLFYAAANGEFVGLQRAWTEGVFSLPFVLALVANALTAFCLNIVSFQANKVAGALTISVCGNLKQCLTIVLGILLFNVQVTGLNGLGMIVTVSGAAWYTKVELDSKRVRNDR